MRAARPIQVLTISSVAVFLLLGVLQCGAQVPASDHVVLLVAENHSYSQVVGNTAAMPYLNSLINTYGLATNYDANSHYSIPNYFWLTTGTYVTLNDGSTSVFNVDNVTRYLMSAGKTWKAYEESIPSVGYTGPTVEPYERNHDPFVYLSDVVNSSAKMNIVPFTQFAMDIANNQLPNFSFITPNSKHDGHTANLAAMDQWLKTSLAPLFASPAFQPGGNGLLIITFDESLDADCLPLPVCPKLPENGGGGHVATMLIGPNVLSGKQSATFYQHPSVLKTALLALGIAGAPGAAQSAPAMLDFFSSVTAASTCTASGLNLTMTMCAPSTGQALTSPVHVMAIANSTTPVQYSQVYVDGVKQYQVTGATVDTHMAMTPGSHRVTVQANNGTLFKSTLYITVQ